MLKTAVNRLMIFGIVCLLIFGTFSSALAEGSPSDMAENSTNNVKVELNNSHNEYEKYIASYSDSMYAESDIIVESLTPAELDEKSKLLTEELKDSNAICLDVNGMVSYDVSVSEAGLYNFALSFLSSSVNAATFKISLQIDGGFEYSNLSNIIFNTYWKNLSGKNRYDNNGNEITPEQILSSDFVTEKAKDNTGVVIEPYLIYLSEGLHRITINSLSHSFVMNRFGFYAPEQTVPYNQLKMDTSNKSDGIDVVYIEGEDAKLKSSNSLVPKSDSSSAVNPKSAFSNLLNYIGSTTWQNPGEKLEYAFEIKKSGYYKIAFNYKQSDVINGESFRWLKIDGKTPFNEAKCIRFPYAVNWTYYEYKDGEEPFYFWLEKGQHTISLEVTLGNVSEYYKRLENIVSVLGEQYTKIAMITSDSPDINRDYELFRQLPDLDSTLKTSYDDLDQLSSDIKRMSGKRASQYSAALDNMKMVLKSMYSNPYFAHQYVRNYYSNYCTVSSWLYEMKEMPLSLDQIQIVPSSTNYPGNNSNFINSMFFSIKRFIASFVSNYSNSPNTDDSNNDGLEIWVNWGIDQASTLKQLVQDYFTPETGIPVNIRVTNASLIKGIMSGHFPDLSLHLSRTEPVNLGIRGALYDLSNFDDYTDVLKNFGESANIPYQYNGKVYALPDTQSFYVMFYRSDILKELGLDVPKTWDEYIKALTVIQHRNMQVYIPYTEITTTTTVHTGLGGLNLFPTLLLQKGASIYNSEKTASVLNNTTTIETFDFWIGLYKNYNCLKEANFYNRFKVGTMPLGIAPYNTYLTLKETAPEIEGRWGIALVPGFSEDNHTVSGSGTGCAIVNKSEHKQEAWEFLKWWVSKDIQLKYSNQLEALLGLVGRVSSANVEAVKNMDWDAEAREVLLEQWGFVNELPEVPGSYYLTRAVDQAFWSSVNNNTNTKATLSKWEKVANQEIERKIKEYIN